MVEKLLRFDEAMSLDRVVSAMSKQGVSRNSVAALLSRLGPVDLDLLGKVLGDTPAVDSEPAHVASPGGVKTDGSLDGRGLRSRTLSKLARDVWRRWLNRR